MSHPKHVIRIGQTSGMGIPVRFNPVIAIVIPYNFQLKCWRWWKFANSAC